MNINLKPFRKYKNIFYYIFRHSLLISLIPATLAILITFFLSIHIGIIIALIVMVYDLIIFELIDDYLWKKNIKNLKNYNRID